MKAFYRKPINIPYDYIEAYVNNKDICKNSNLLFKYLYLLCKKRAINNKIEFNNSDSLELFSIKCASIIFNSVEDNDFDFNTAFDKVSKDVFYYNNDDNFYLDDTGKDFLFKNYIIDRIQYYTFGGYCDITAFPTYIKDFVNRLPKKKNSSELNDIYTSILYSFYYTINKYNDSIFDFETSIVPKIILYNLPKTYFSYINSIVIELIYTIRDSFNKTLSNKYDNIYSIRLKDFIRGGNCKEFIR